ncbi:MAG: hypothetical protein QNJ64_15045 [Crocosphaera sp.]|nr:hypothetical protein [Crocosphaera sp.]
MAKDCLQSLESSLEITQESQLSSNRIEQKIVFYTNQIVYYLESAVDKFQQGTDISFECSKIEENLQLLRKVLDANWETSQEFHYKKILHTSFRLKCMLSEICFGGLLKKKNELIQKETNQFHTHLVTIQNSSKKLKGLAEVFAI